MNDNERFTDPFGSGEWAGEEGLTVSLKLQLDGSRHTGARGCLQVQRRDVNQIDCSDGIKLSSELFDQGDFTRTYWEIT